MFTATEYTRSQTNGRPYRVGWHKFATRRAAEAWAKQRIATPMMAPHWIQVRAYRSKQTLSEYRSEVTV